MSRSISKPGTPPADSEPDARSLVPMAIGSMRLTRGRVMRLATLLLAAILVIGFAPSILAALNLVPRSNVVAVFFTREVRQWENDIARWSSQYGVDPNLAATLMQIESCGLPSAASSEGAQGLFQVMPMHFVGDEVNRMTDPDTNARRGLGVILDCLQRANNDFGLALACYNGGPAWIGQPLSSWPAETRRYYTWGTGIYSDARNGAARSMALEDWLQAGGIYLCQEAAIALNLPPGTPFSAPGTLPPPEFPLTPLPTLQVAPGAARPTAGLPTMPVGQRPPPTALAPGALPTFNPNR